MPVEYEEVETEEENNVIPFDPARRATLTGGRDVTPWLLMLPEGSHFLIWNENQSKSELILCILLRIYSEKTVIIESPQSGKIYYVYPLHFCRENKLHEVLHRGEVVGE